MATRTLQAAAMAVLAVAGACQIPEPPPLLVQELASADPAARAAAQHALDALSKAERIALLRRGLRYDGPAGIACATRLEWWYLDAQESERVVELVTSGLRAQQPDLDFDNFRFILGSSELGGLLADFPPAPPGWKRSQMLAHLHRQVRAEHLPALCTLATGMDRELRDQSIDNVRVTVGYTDQHRDTVARMLLALRPLAERVDKDHNPYGVGSPEPLPPPGDKPGWPDLLCRALELVFLSDFAANRWEWSFWAARWALAVPPASEDLPLMDRLLATQQEPIAVAVLHGLETIPGEAATTRLRAIAQDADQERALRTLAQGVLARRGDAEALAALATGATGVDALVVLTWAAPDRGRAAMAARLLGPDTEGAAATLRELQDFLNERVSASPLGVELDEHAFEGLTEAALRAPLDTMRLASLYKALPEVRSEPLRRLLFDRLRQLPEEADPEPLHWLCCVLEAEDLEGLGGLLHCWLDSGRAPLAGFASRELRKLGDARAGQLFVRAATGTEGVEALLCLARCQSPEVEAFLQARAEDPQAASATRDAALAALGVLHGLPENTALHLLGRLSDGKDSGGARALLREGKAIDALCALHRIAPDRVPDLGRIRDPRITAILKDLRDRRELGCHAWAVGELARQGDVAARAELQQLFADGRYGWIDEATHAEVSLGFELRDIAAWAGELESNCCRAVPIDMTLDDAVGLDFRNGAPWSDRTEADAVRRWFKRFGSRLRWSRLAGRYVVA